MASFFKQAYDRLSGETPTFFKKVGVIGNSITGIGTSFIVPEIVPSVHMPAILITIGTHAVIAGLIMTTVAKFACVTPPVVSIPENTNIIPSVQPKP